MCLLKKINALEPLWWSLFGAGGMVAAFLLPAHIFIQGIAIPLGWVSPDMFNYSSLIGIVGNPIVKIYLFFMIILPLYHAAYRIRLTLEDLRIEWLNHILPLIFYGGATGLTVVTLIVLIRI